MPVGIILSQVFFGIVIFLVSTFLILLVLVQRGRGGGLTGALGGPGGQSAFGTKAGDVFTKITIVTAALWIFFCALGVWWMQQGDLPLSNASNDSVSAVNGMGSDASGSDATKSNEPNTGGLPAAPSVPQSQAPAAPAQGNGVAEVTNNAATPEATAPAAPVPALVAPAPTEPEKKPEGSTEEKKPESDK